MKSHCRDFPLPRIRPFAPRPSVFPRPFPFDTVIPRGFLFATAKLTRLVLLLVSPGASRCSPRAIGKSRSIPLSPLGLAAQGTDPGFLDEYPNLPGRGVGPPVLLALLPPIIQPGLWRAGLCCARVSWLGVGGPPGPSCWGNGPSFVILGTSLFRGRALSELKTRCVPPNPGAKLGGRPPLSAAGAGRFDAVADGAREFLFAGGVSALPAPLSPLPGPDPQPAAQFSFLDRRLRNSDVWSP